jgi:hypothetical protein
MVVALGDHRPQETRLPREELFELGRDLALPYHHQDPRPLHPGVKGMQDLTQDDTQREDVRHGCVGAPPSVPPGRQELGPGVGRGTDPHRHAPVVGRLWHDELGGRREVLPSPAVDLLHQMAVGQRAGQAKVGELHDVVVPRKAPPQARRRLDHEDVGGFEIAVDEPPPVDVFEALHDLPELIETLPVARLVGDDGPLGALEPVKEVLGVA